MQIDIRQAAVEVPYSVRATTADFDQLRIQGQQVLPVFADSYADAIPGTWMGRTVPLRAGRQTLIEVSSLLAVLSGMSWAGLVGRVQLKVNGALIQTSQPQNLQYAKSTATFFLEYNAPSDGDYLIEVALSITYGAYKLTGNNTYYAATNAQLPIQTTVTIWT